MTAGDKDDEHCHRHNAAEANKKRDRETTRLQKHAVT